MPNQIAEKSSCRFFKIYIIVSLKGKRKEFLVADAKPDELLHSLKYEYGDELEWLLPYPRDWHTLKSVQVKAYFDAGLKNLASVSSYVPSTSYSGEFGILSRDGVRISRSDFGMKLQCLVEAGKDTGFLTEVKRQIDQ